MDEALVLPNSSLLEFHQPLHLDQGCALMLYQDPYVLMGQFWLDGRLIQLESSQNTNSSPGPTLGVEVKYTSLRTATLSVNLRGEDHFQIFRLYLFL